MWTHSADVMLGRLIEKSEASGRSIERLEWQAMQRLNRIDGHLETMSRDLTTMAKDRSQEPVSRIERRLKDWAGWLIPAAVLWATGSLQTALEVLKAMK